MLAKKQFGSKTKDGEASTGEVDMATGRKSRRSSTSRQASEVFDRQSFPSAPRMRRRRRPSPKSRRRYFTEPTSRQVLKLMSVAVYTANRIPRSDTIVGIDNAMKWGYANEAGPSKCGQHRPRGVRQEDEADGLKIPQTSTMLSRATRHSQDRRSKYLL